MNDRPVLTLELPFPPSLNHYWRRVGNRTLLSAQGRAYKARVAAMLLTLRVRPLTGRLAVEIDLYPPDRRRRDLDNCGKCLLDSLAGPAGVFLDDGQIDRLTFTRRPMLKGGGEVIVRVYLLLEDGQS